jgi:hypothetical protein
MDATGGGARALLRATCKREQREQREQEEQ